MKRILALILFFIVLATGAVAGDLQPYNFPLIGKWVPSGQSIMSPEEYGLQDVQNLRREGKAWVGVKGHTAINTTLLSSYPYITNGFHFRKTNPAESHVLVVAGDNATPSNSVVYENETAIPTAGDFNASVWYTDTGAGMGQGRFSYAPGGQMVYSNGVVQYIWGGDETRITAFYTGSAAITSTTTTIPNPADYSEKLTNSTTTDNCHVGTVFFVGTTRPVSGFKFYLSTNSTTTATMSATVWTTAGWASVTNPTDGTLAGGKTLSQAGSFTFDSTVGTATPRYIQGFQLYWYQFVVTSDPDAVIYQVTAISPAQSIKNIWNGALVKATKVEKYGNDGTNDYTDDVSDGSQSTSASFTCDTDDYVYFGGVSPSQGISVTLKNTEGNGNVAATKIYYWSGTAWTEVSGLTDATVHNTHTLGVSGVISWNPLGSTEQKHTLNDNVPLYYYKLMVSAATDSTTGVAEIRLIPATEEVKVYKFSELFQNRLFLLNEVNGKQNALRYSAANAPDVYNGTDSGFLYVGDDSALIAARPVFNIFKAGAYDQLIICKANETWRLSGDGPASWSLARINANIGCVAPLTMVSAEVSESMEEGVKRQVVFFMGNDGVYVTDGASVLPISDDIRCYFDSNDARAIPAAMLSKSFGWYDPTINSYKLLIASGASATSLNTELEYNLSSREWTKVYRADSSGANPILSGWSALSTSGTTYTYGGNTKGNVYRLENGYTWAGTAIAQYLWTKDFIPDQQLPFLRKSTIRNFRAVSKDQTGTMTVTHYGDGTATVNGTNNQNTLDSINLDTAPYNSQSCLLGPFLYHSFKFACSASTNTGMELSGFGFWWEPYLIWR